MGKRRLCTHIIIGAVVGGLVALTNKDVRLYTKSKLACAQEKTGEFIKNPSNTLHSTRVAFEKFSESFSDGAANTINALDQIEQTIDKFIDKEES